MQSVAPPQASPAAQQSPQSPGLCLSLTTRPPPEQSILGKHQLQICNISQQKRIRVDSQGSAEQKGSSEVADTGQSVQSDAGSRYQPVTTHSTPTRTTNGALLSPNSTIKVSFQIYIHTTMTCIINPRRACAARVTVLGLYVCV